MKLNLGSGCLEKGLFWSGEDWVNVDRVAFKDGRDWSNAKYLDFDMSILPWPIESGSVDCIWASHILEHFDYNEVQDVIAECYRVLKDGAPMRMTCPDPRKFIAAFQANNTKYIVDTLQPSSWAAFDYEHHLNWGYTDMFFPGRIDHALCSSIDLISIFLIRAGFKKLKEMDYKSTEFPKVFGSGDKMIDIRPVCFGPDPVFLSWFLEASK